jgi:hypothetical protein
MGAHGQCDNEEHGEDARRRSGNHPLRVRGNEGTALEISRLDQGNRQLPRENLSAIRLYGKHGFQLSKRWVISGIDMVTMEWHGSAPPPSATYTLPHLW